jgi:hypothetical protein
MPLNKDSVRYFAFVHFHYFANLSLKFPEIIVSTSGYCKCTLACYHEWRNLYSLEKSFDLENDNCGTNVVSKCLKV